MPALYLSHGLDASIPVLQMSLPLRDEGVLIIGYGFTTRGLPYLRDFRPGAQAPGWSKDFDAWAAETLARGAVDELAVFTHGAPGMWSAAADQRDETALVVALHGRGATEQDFGDLAAFLPGGSTVASVRGPIPEGTGYAWFANRGIARPHPESLQRHTAELLAWLDSVESRHEKVVLFGFSGGTAMAGSLLLTDPNRFDAAVVLSGTLPWDTGLDDSPGVLTGKPIFYVHSDDDGVIPADLIARTRHWLRDVSGAALVEPAYTGFGHGISPAELRDVAGFIEGVLTKDED